MNPIVVFDLDGVLLDFESAWARCASRELGRPVRKVSDAYDLQDRYALSSREYHRARQALHRGSWWERIPAHESARDVVCAVEASGASVWAVTNIDARWIRARAISLGGLIPFGRIICLGEDASPHDRAEILDDLHAQAFVDDQSPNANAAVGIVAAPVLLHRGYQGLEPPAHGVTVIDDLRDFPETLRGFLTRRLPA
ncbi:HAD family hydrolase [Acidithiobacillus sulfuriphilus]|uniref:HAD family hydrolase n=1 Tax=Acidithiobacillus sulfuriphilus TaxID=1867749 RepID=UPI003F61DAA2